MFHTTCSSHTHLHTYKCMHMYMYTHSTHTHTHMHTHSRTHTRSHCLLHTLHSLTVSRTLTCTCTHTVSLTLTCTHAHTHSYPHRHASLSLQPTVWRRAHGSERHSAVRHTSQRGHGTPPTGGLQRQAGAESEEGARGFPRPPWPARGGARGKPHPLSRRELHWTVYYGSCW